MFFLCFGSALICLLMACVNNQLDHPNFKHYCRVCKKGFMCGRALGGHMRAHGIGDDAAALDDADDASDWEDKFDRNNTSKRMYQLRTNPNRLKSCKTCENCGKEFLSWKSFLEHGNGKCASDDAASESLVSSDDGDDDSRRGNWSKRKRSLRSKVGSTTSEEEDLLLATCLVQLANTTVDLEAEESSASASKEEERRSAYFASSAAPPPKSRAKVASTSPRGLFECKACKKVFNSHQALGGHRASHKKVKGCYAAKQDEPDDSAAPAPAAVEKDDQDFFPSQKAAAAFQFDQGQPPLVGAARRKSKVHECSICHRVFNSGQALGGHKRCHWIISNSPDPKFQYQEHQENNVNNNKGSNADVAAGDKLDLNVPAWAHMSGVRRDPRNPLSFDVSTDMHLRPWMGARAANNNNNNNNDGSEKGKGEVSCHVEDEADSKLKLAKLSDLNDANVGSSQWLQVGIGSATTEAVSGDA